MAETETTPAALGKNAAADLRGRAEELAGVLDDIAELQERAKEIKADAKSEGYDMKAFAQIVKEKRRGPDYQADQLQLELVLDTYRKAVDLPTDLAVAQKLAKEQAESLPARGGDDDEYEDANGRRRRKKPERKDLN